VARPVGVGAPSPEKEAHNEQPESAQGIRRNGRYLVESGSLPSGGAADTDARTICRSAYLDPFDGHASTPPYVNGRLDANA